MGRATLPWLATAVLAAGVRTIRADGAADVVDGSSNTPFRDAFLDGSLDMDSISDERVAVLEEWARTKTARLRRRADARFERALQRGEDPEALPERKPLAEMTNEEVAAELRELTGVELAVAQGEADDAEMAVEDLESDPDATAEEIALAQAEADAAETAVEVAEEEVEIAEEVEECGGMGEPVCEEDGAAECEDGLVNVDGECADEEEMEEEVESDVSEQCSGDLECVPPSTKSSLQHVLGESKFSAPTSGDQVDDLECFCNKYFYLSPEDYMCFITTDERSELRIPTNVGREDGFDVNDVTASLKATLRLLSPEIGEEDNYTFMQLHGEDTSWIRLAHYGRKNVEDDPEDAFNFMWMFIKHRGDLTSLPMGPVPDGDFRASIDLPGDGTVEICAGDFCETFDIEWSDKHNYFKAGVYVQDGTPDDFEVCYKELAYELS